MCVASLATKCVTTRHRKTDRGKSGDDHVQALDQRSVVEHGGIRVYIQRFAVVPVHAGRAVHPTVGAYHEHRRCDAGEADANAAKPMNPFGYSVPAVEENAERDGFEEKGGAFPTEGHADDGTGDFHEARPQ